MARRPLVATVATTVIGSVCGAGLGAVVGRVIALIGDETVETSLPMVFCGTIGYFVGGASAAKGTLDRFGARRTGLGATVATLVMVLAVGYTFFARAAGEVVFGVGLLAAALAGVAAAFAGGPQPVPVTRGQRPRAVGAPSKQAATAPSESAESEFVEAPDRRSRPPRSPVPKPAIRKVPVTPERTADPEQQATDDTVNWSLDEASAAKKPAAKKATPKQPAAKKKAAAKKPAAKPKRTPQATTRPARDRPLRSGDA
ncbi:MAG TPA: hypothetical protein VMZ22_06280 [Acidimicrobiales bacterium]|nr:hypothetical protein [Acidimicrobiales bacterium]